LRTLVAHAPGARRFARSFFAPVAATAQPKRAARDGNAPLAKKLRASVARDQLSSN